MTTETRGREVFSVDAQTYWRHLCLNLDYQERLYREAIGCTRMEVVELVGSYETGQTRKLRFEKPIDAPAAVRKLFGDTVTLEEHSEFDPKTQRWSFRMVPPVLADKLLIRGVIHLEPRTGAVEQVSVNTVSCDLFGVGAIIERFVAKSTVEGARDKAAFTRRYIAEKSPFAAPTRAQSGPCAS